jgi:2-aminoadipate transaminase
MRLNFSGVSEEEIREGVRRIGQTVAGQVELFSAVSGTRRPGPAVRGGGPQTAPAGAGEAGEAALADVFELPRRPGPAREARRRPSP